MGHAMFLLGDYFMEYFNMEKCDSHESMLEFSTLGVTPLNDSSTLIMNAIKLLIWCCLKRWHNLTWSLFWIKRLPQAGTKHILPFV
jgi:hypothetical protein